MRLKSGQMTLLKTWALIAAMVPGNACTQTGRVSCDAIESIMSGSAAMWSRCECVSSTCSMPAISSSVRSPTPVPASTSTSRSMRKDVVRHPLAMAPEQPSTRTRMSAPATAAVVPTTGARREMAGSAGHGSPHLVSKLVAPSHSGSKGSKLIEATRS